ncbi:hypothetical protein GF314_05495 [bacterium]|nr:hypothetical protein [bacterium]
MARSPGGPPVPRGGRSPMPFRPVAGMPLVLAFLMVLAAPAPGQSDAVEIALVVDGTGVDSRILPALLREEITQLLRSDFDVTIHPDDRFRGDETLAGVTAAVDRALADPDIDLVVTAGVLGSLIAGQRTDLPRPVIAPVAISAEVQGLPLTPRGTSGRPNLTYILDQDLFADDLAVLEAVAGDLDHVALLGSEALFLALPGIEPGARFPLPGGVRGTVCSAGRDAATGLASLPDDVDGVAVIGLPGFGAAAIDSLSEGLIARRLPSVSVVGELAVESGILCGTISKSWLQRLARRVALHARKILTGTEAGALPVLMPRERAVFINAETARRIGVYPPFAVTVDAVLIDSERATGRHLDLWQAMDEAMLANRDLAAAGAQLEADRASVAIARSTLLPQIDLSATGTILDEDRALASSRPAERSLTAGATLSQVIVSDDAWSSYTVQKRLLEQREAEYEEARLDVALRAASAYFEVLRAKTFERLQKANLALSRENLERALVRVKLGDASRAEEYRWQAKIADEKAQLIAAIAERNVAEMELNRVLNRPLEESILLSEPDLDGQLSLLLDPRLERYLGDAWHLEMLREYGTAYARRVAPELLQLEAGILAQERILANAKRSFLVPDVLLSLGWQTYLDEGGAGTEMRPDGFPDDDDWNASLVVSLPLFEGGRRFAETRQAGRDLLALRTGLEATSERIEQRVRTAVHRTSASRAGIGLSREAAAAARRNLELVSDAYTRGAVDLITLLDAQTSQLNADLAAADAAYQFLLDLMELERAIGRFTYFATEDERDAWLTDLEAWFADRQPSRE